MPRILIVDDELSMRDFLKILFENEGYEVFVASNAATALDVAIKDPFDVVITDIRMPGMNGLELLVELKQHFSDLPVVMITAYASPDDAVQAMRQGAFDYITKPFHVDELKNVIRTAVQRKASAEKNEAVETFAGIIGSSPEMLRIFDLIRRVAPTPASVLIYGESGTGKELVAKAIHQHSKVVANPFVPITCSAIPESLLESELFGHVKGSFTGAVADKPGLFQQADSGTAFLDEIGELTPIIQTKLLRVLQEREFMPVGSTKTKQVNVRIISATNRNLEDEIMEKRFREDLFYRLAVVPIRVPPLRERKGDVPLLVDYFLKKYSELFGKEVQNISSYGLEVLMDYNFPGNVRELENIIERGVALETSNIILPESLILSRKEKAGSQKEPLFVGAQDERELFDRGMEDILIDLETRMIKHALEAAEGSKMRAAELLKVSFRSFRYKTKKYEID
ncbi:two-component system, NtrC family, response regulator PilR [Candidatus Electrothrix aarhusensis]|jgi:two-component system response regulator PilR (NtrC family)|uniref:Two-component system, NtrC family, response regulator PilR n=1 Tax=Candidatus Electrothrix aarhusensis TaxID=1859131 RepID=A0A444J1M4_9BACT|nr:two-component system, NtrC family, response regulator PilR [Candidatus Electrothrix aarhusensis]